MKSLRPGLLVKQLVGIAGLLAAASAALAGPLDPPTGPIAPTPGPEPRIAINQTNTPGDANSIFRITQPGSYYLTGNVSGASGFHGIEVASTVGLVTIDLNGFALLGVSGSLDGINNEVGAMITVRNGTASTWGGNGVEGTRIEDVRAIGNGGSGISCLDRAIVTRCVVSSNGAAQNRFGLLVGSNSIVSDCVVTQNGGASTGGGISTSATSRVEGCIVTSNGNSAVSGNGWGISVGSDSTVVDCRLTSNGRTDLANSGGINAGVGSEIRSCMLYDNSGVGIQLTGEGVIIGNKVQGVNDVPVGIRIPANGFLSRVEDNHVMDCVAGIRVLGTNNTLIRNTCRSNATNFDIAPGNDVGPIGTAATALAPFANIQGP